MPNLAAFMAGGLFSGVGEGLAEKGKAMREKKLRELEHGYRMEEGAARDTAAFERTKLSDEGQTARTGMTNQAAMERTRLTEGGATARSQASIDAQNSRVTGGPFADASGNLHAMTGSGATVDLGITGAPNADKNATAEMRNYQFAVNTLGMSQQDAAAWVRQSKDKSPEQVRNDIYTRIIGTGFVSPDRAAEQTRKAMEFLYGSEGAAPGLGTGKPATPDAQETGSGPGSSRESAIDVKTPDEVRSNVKVGGWYRTPDGQVRQRMR